MMETVQTARVAEPTDQLGVRLNAPHDLLGVGLLFIHRALEADVENLAVRDRAPESLVEDGEEPSVALGSHRGPVVRECSHHLTAAHLGVRTHGVPTSDPVSVYLSPSGVDAKGVLRIGRLMSSERDDLAPAFLVGLHVPREQIFEAPSNTEARIIVRGIDLDLGYSDTLTHIFRNLFSPCTRDEPASNRQDESIQYPALSTMVVSGPATAQMPSE